MRIILISIFFFLNATSGFAQSNALDFDGVDDFVNLDVLSTGLSGRSAFTIEFIFKAKTEDQVSSIRTSIFAINPRTPNGNGLLIILGGLNAQEGKLLIYDEGQFGAAPDFISTDVFADGECHRLSYVRNGTTGILYVDGVKVGEHNTVFNISNSDLISLGQEYDNTDTNPVASQFYNGEIDDLRVWDRALPLNQIQSSLFSPLTGIEPGLIAYYMFNQGQAGLNNPNESILENIVSNDFFGNLINFSLTGLSSNWVEGKCLGCENQTNVEDINSCSDTLITFPDGNSLLISESTSYTSNLTSVLGCDSTIITNVFVSKDTILQDTTILCFGDAVTLPDNTVVTDVQSSFDYTSGLTNAFGCDSIIESHIMVLDTSLVLVFDTICSGENYTFPDGSVIQNLTTDLTQNSILNGSNACDSTIITNIFVAMDTVLQDTTVLCFGDTVILPDNTVVTDVQSSFDYTSGFTNALGCDSIIESHIMVLDTSLVLVFDTICSGENYTFPDGSVVQNLTTDLTQNSILNGSNACDSTIITNVFVAMDTILQDTTIICFGDTVILPDNTVVTDVQSSFDYTSGLTNVLGCDSIIESHIMVRDTSLELVFDTICSGENYTFPDGSVIQNPTTDLTQNSILKGLNACDSTIITSLVVLPEFYFEIDTVLCQGDSYVLPNGELMDSVLFSQSIILSYETIFGCDSTIEVFISVLEEPLISFESDSVLCEGEELILSVNNRTNSSLLWSTGDTSETIRITKPDAYRVTAKNNCGEQSREINVIQEFCSCNLFIPNAFSPDGDGLNETFFAVTSCDLPFFFLEIFNRWGERVYVSKDANEQWSGLYKAKESKTGIYPYKVTYSFNGDDFPVKFGHVQLIR